MLDKNLVENKDCLENYHKYCEYILKFIEKQEKK